MKIDKQKNISHALDLILSTLADKSDTYMIGFNDAQDGYKAVRTYPNEAQAKEWQEGYNDGVFVQQYIDGDFDTDD